METGRRVLAEMVLPDRSEFKGRARDLTGPSLSLSFSSIRAVSERSSFSLSPFFRLSFARTLCLRLSFSRTTTHLPTRLSSLWLDHDTTSKGLSRLACYTSCPLSVSLSHSNPFATQGTGGKGESRCDANSSPSFFPLPSLASFSLSLSFANSCLSPRSSRVHSLAFFLSRPSLSNARARTRRAERETNSKSAGGDPPIGHSRTTWITPPTPASARHWLLFARRFSQPATRALRECVHASA